MVGSTPLHRHLLLYFVFCSLLLWSTILELELGLLSKSKLAQKLELARKKSGNTRKNSNSKLKTRKYFELETWFLWKKKLTKINKFWIKNILLSVKQHEMKLKSQKCYTIMFDNIFCWFKTFWGVNCNKITIYWLHFQNSKLARKFWNSLESFLPISVKTRTRLELKMQYSNELELEKSRLDHIPSFRCMIYICKLLRDCNGKKR